MLLSQLCTLLGEKIENPIPYILLPVYILLPLDDLWRVFCRLPLLVSFYGFEFELYDDKSLILLLTSTMTSSFLYYFMEYLVVRWIEGPWEEA